jgi:hypothetical protein
VPSIECSLSKLKQTQKCTAVSCATGAPCTLSKNLFTFAVGIVVSFFYEYKSSTFIKPVFSSVVSQLLYC